MFSERPLWGQASVSHWLTHLLVLSREKAVTTTITFLKTAGSIENFCEASWVVVCWGSRGAMPDLIFVHPDTKIFASYSHHIKELR